MSDTKTSPASDFYDVLEVCTNAEIMPIVDMLINSPVSILKMCRAFELHAPDPQRYVDRICDELYRLATMALGITDGVRPSYTAMLNGLSKKIGLPFTAGDASVKEASLFSAFASQHLLTVAAADRQRIVDEVCAAASKAAGGLLSSDAWPPFAAALLQVAHLRSQLIEDGRLAIQSAEVSMNLPTIAGNETDALVVQIEDGEPVLALATIPGDITGWQPVTQGDRISGVLYPILEAVQPLLAGQQMFGGETLYKSILPHGAKLDTVKDTANMVYGSARGGNGLFVKSPFKTVSAAGVMGPMALMTLASAMIEQHKLEQIEKSLAEIKASLQDVAKFQKGERRSILTGSIRYFQQVATSVVAGELADEILHGLERHEVELLRVQEHLVDEARTQIAAFRAIKKEGWGSSKYAKSLGDELAVLASTYEELFLCMRARACAYMLLCAFPGREIGKKVRLDDITSTLETFSLSGEATVALDLALRDKLQGISSFETKGLLLTQETALLNSAATGSAEIIAGLNSAIQPIDAHIAQQSFAIKFEGDRPIAVKALSLADQA